MSFLSLDFAVFFGLTLGLVMLLPRRWSNWVLLVASLFSYACWSRGYLMLVVFSAVLDFALSWEVYRAPNRARKKMLLACSVFYNLAILSYFKYANFLLGALTDLGVPLNGLRAVSEMPVGISFFTFQSVGYLVDVYRGRRKPSASARDYLLFVSFFPQMMSGPIERAGGFLRQLESERRITAEGVYVGASRVLWGLFQKLVIADNLAPGINAAFEHPEKLNGASLALAVLLFGLELYADFAGYCDMALGMAQMLGLRLSENFRAPWLARDASEFWRRWNITLMAWFRDYVYFPLSRGGSGWRSTLAVAVVFTLSGLWHGAAWHFAFWGFINGLLVLLVRLYEHVKGPWIPNLLARPLTLISLGATLIFFRSPTMETASAIAQRILQLAPGKSYSSAGIPWEASLGVIALLLLDWWKEPLSFSQWFARLGSPTRVLYLTGVCAAIVLLGAKAGVRFLYLDF